MNPRHIIATIKTGLCGLFLFVPAASPVWAQSDLPNRTDPRAMYDKMIQSLSAFDYRGILTYEQGGSIQTFLIASEAVDNQVDQMLEKLDGPMAKHSYQFEIDCDRPARKTARELSDYYNFYTRGDTRIAGHDGVEIVLSPVDKYRNGFHYVIDPMTGLMLRSMVLTPDRRMVERTQFVSLDYRNRAAPRRGADAPPEDVLEDVLVGAENSGDDSREVGCTPLRIENGWAAGWLPAGFELVGSELDADRANLVYADGISMFTVFIESVLESFLPPSNAQRGATTVYLDYLSDQSSTYLVSIVGEVPIATSERVLGSLRRN